jgi:2-methylcitrate dehydratase
MSGFVGPRDVFRNPEAIFRYLEPTTSGSDRWKEQGDSPFELVLTHSGDDFAVMGMHFKLGLYEHQSAGALQGVIELLVANPELIGQLSQIGQITIVAYEPAFGIIGNPMKKDPRTRQSADHSMAYIVATLLRKAHESGVVPQTVDEAWKTWMLTPYDYQVSESAMFHPLTRSLMERIDFKHGGPEYDARYPDGIPTSVTVRTAGRPDEQTSELSSGLVMYPAGHARNTTADLRGILAHKWRMLGSIARPDGEDPQPLIDKLEDIARLDARNLASLYDTEIHARSGYETVPDSSLDD